jgi:hypothetical protein
LYKDIPKAFSDEEIYDIDNYKDYSALQMKEYGELIKNYKSIYKVDSEKIIKGITDIGSNFGRLLIHESFLLWFPDYFIRYCNTIDTLFYKDEFIPINWRFYIALMVI